MARDGLSEEMRSIKRTLLSANGKPKRKLKILEKDEESTFLLDAQAQLGWRQRRGEKEGVFFEIDATGELWTQAYAKVAQIIQENPNASVVAGGQLSGWGFYPSGSIIKALEVESGRPVGGMGFYSWVGVKNWPRLKERIPLLSQEESLEDAVKSYDLVCWFLGPEDKKEEQDFPAFKSSGPLPTRLQSWKKPHLEAYHKEALELLYALGGKKNRKQERFYQRSCQLFTQYLKTQEEVEIFKTLLRDVGTLRAAPALAWKARLLAHA